MSGRYGARPGSRRWVLLIALVLLHGGGLYGLILLDSVRSHRTPTTPPMVVELLPLAPPRSELAPPPLADTPDPRLAPPATVVAPRPIVEAARPVPPPVQAIEAVPPPSVAVVAAAPSAPVAAPAVPAAHDDLATTMISAVAPRYPIESRRRREQGIVVMLVQVGEDGSVESVTIEQSSGFDRLDDAARSAVRKWRWSPRIVGGRPAVVRGFVRIPFELRQDSH